MSVSERESVYVCLCVCQWVSRVLAVRPSPAAPLLLKPPLDWRQKLVRTSLLLSVGRVRVAKPAHCLDTPQEQGEKRKKEKTRQIYSPILAPTPASSINSHQNNLTRYSLLHGLISTLNHTRRCRHQADFSWCLQWGFPSS